MPTKALVQAVNRNRSRFPPDFMFQLTAAEFEVLRSQFVTSNDRSSGGRRYRPYAFTEQGVAMLSSVLRSRRAIASNIQRAFVRLRRLVMAQAELVRKLNALEQKYVVFNVIRKLMA
ncbi:MAG TPA: ORF6N domain-containing protein, partial [Candidatus Binatia bacterium]|nr:ORF6N domain-containing protein [Candidatus Binatia bacterium]